MRIIGAINHYLIPAMIIASIVWGICLFISFCRHKKTTVKIWMIRYVFITYLISVLLITDAYKVLVEAFPVYFMEPNLIPFVHTVEDIFTNPIATLTLIFYNIVLFVPFGFLLVCSFPSHEWKLREILGVTVIVVLIVEVMEYLTGRYLDIDDVFINTFGSILGYYIYILIQRLKQFV